MRKARSNSIDRELFHAWLWENRGRNDILALSGAEIARQFHFSRQTPVRLFGELVEAGRLIKTRRGYQVVDPNLF